MVKPLYYTTHPNHPHMPLPHRDIHKSIELACALIVATALFAYGVGKTVQFSAPPPETALGDLSPMQLMWAFYAHSLPFALFIGAMEVLGGLLLLVPRTRIIGGLLLTGILTNIILQDIFYEVNAGALRAAMLYQGLTLVVLWYRRATLISGFRTLMQRSDETLPRRRQLVVLLLAVIIAVVIKYMEITLTRF